MRLMLRDRVEAVRALLVSPNSLYNLVLFCCHFALLITSSFLAPLLLRYFSLPSSIEHRVPLPIVFNTCNDQLHGVCSFPSAVYGYDVGDVFSPGITYSLNAEFRLPDTESNRHLGVFQVVVRTLDDQQRIVSTTQRSVFVRKHSSFTKLTWLVFFPLYFLGFFDDSLSVTVTLTETYIETLERPSTQLVFELQNRFIQLESITLIVTARFGLVRYLLYNWPLLTSFAITLATFCFFGFFLFIFWTHKAFTFIGQKENKKRQEEETRQSAAQDVGNKKAAILTEEKEIEKVKSDEFLPENTDEVPECPSLSNIPGWEEPQQPSSLLRHRVLNHNHSSGDFS